MFSNRVTALVDACSLAEVLRRNLMLTLAEAGFFRLRWSRRILDETEEAIRRIVAHKGEDQAVADADLLTRMEGRGLIETADVLRPYRESL